MPGIRRSHSTRSGLLVANHLDAGPAIAGLSDLQTRYLPGGGEDLADHLLVVDGQDARRSFVHGRVSRAAARIRAAAARRHVVQRFLVDPVIVQAQRPQVVGQTVAGRAGGIRNSISGYI